jgi:hypothetical protein
MIAAVASPGAFLNILRVRSLRGGELEVPVSPVQSAYARFEHLRAVPSAEGGVSLFKLRVLDKLIDRLLDEGRPAAGRPAAEAAALRSYSRLQSGYEPGMLFQQVA